MTKRDNTEFNPRIGEVYVMQFDGTGSEQNGWRPGIVFQNNVGNRFSPNIIALPLTSAIKKAGQPTHVILKANNTGLRMDSMVLCENPECISKSKVGNYITTIPAHYMKQIAEASLMATSAIIYLDPASLAEIWRRANELYRAFN